MESIISSRTKRANMLVKIVVLYNFVFDIFLSFTVKLISKIHLQSHLLYATQNVMLYTKTKEFAIDSKKFKFKLLLTIHRITYFFSRCKYILCYLGLKLLYRESQEPNLQSLSDEWQKIYPKG